MDSAYVKRTLRVPILRTLGRCVVGAKERGQLLVRRRRNKWSSRGGGGRGASRRDRPARRRSSNNRRNKEPVVTCSYSYQASCSYQADLGKERTSGEDMNTRRNAERATMRGHFRSKYRLGKNRKDAKHLRSAGGKVSLPTELSKLVRPKSCNKSQSKGEASFSLLSAFQNLSFGSAGPAKKTPTPRSPTTHVPVGPCKVM